MDVKITFFNSDVYEMIYMNQPEGFEVKGKKELLCKYRKSLYKVKHGPRQWYKKFNNFMKKVEFARCEADHFCYFKESQGLLHDSFVYVDDMTMC